MSALWSGTTLDSASFRAAQVMGRDPVFSIGLGTGRDRRSISIRLLTSDIDLLDRSLCALTLLLLWEVRGNPDGVEEVANANGAGEEEEVEEDAVSC